MASAMIRISIFGKPMYLQWLNCIGIFVKIWTFRVWGKYATLNARIKVAESLFKNDPLRIYQCIGILAWELINIKDREPILFL